MSLLPLAVLFTLLSPSLKQVQWPLWNSYAARFLQSDGRVMDPSRDNMTTSEGQSYAMFFALVANDQVHYDQLYRWTVNNLAQGDLGAGLPAWSWGRRPDGSFGKLDENSSSDSDLWLAYDLIQAGRLWGKPEYRRAGEALLARVGREEVTTVQGSPVLLPGKTGFVHEKTCMVNPSYLPLFLLQAASKVNPRGPWRELSATLPKLLRQASLAGFAPDWIVVDATGNARPSAPWGGKTTQPEGGYDAIRVYLWAGITAAKAPHRDAVLRELNGMAEVMKTQSLPPEFVAGTPPLLKGDGPLSFSAALVPFLQAVKEPQAAEVQAQRLQAAWSADTGLYGDPPLYYDQSLALFSQGYTEHRYRILPDGDLEVSWTK